MQMFQDCSRSTRLLLLGTLLFAVARLLFVHFGTLDLSPDEAQYWDWSRQLDWSYYSKGPLVAWLLWLTTHLAGSTEVGVRLMAISLQAILVITSYTLVCRLSPDEKTGRRAGWLAFWVLQLTPLFGAGGLLVAPDAPATVCWALSLLVLSQIEWDSAQPQWRRFLLLGLLLGLGGLGKYTVAMFYPLGLLYLSIDATRRQWLWRPQPYVAGLVSGLCVLPILYWNSQHDWASFQHVLGQAGGGRAFQPLLTLGDFLAGQAGALGGLLFIPLVVYIYRGPRAQQGRLLWWFGVPVLALFLLKALTAKVQPNWPVLGVYGTTMGMTIWLAQAARGWRLTAIAGLVMAAALTVPLHDTFLLRHMGVQYPVKHDPLKVMWGWAELGKALGLERAELGDLPVLTTRYQTASELAFYTPGQPHVLYVNPGYRRRNQYDYWPWPKSLPTDMFYVRESHDDVTIDPVVAAAFNSCVLRRQITVFRDGLHLRQANIFICRGFKGIDRLMADHF